MQDGTLYFHTFPVAPVLYFLDAEYLTLRKGGRIVFVSSTLTSFSLVPPTALLYVATKGAIEQLNRVLAKELGERHHCEHDIPWAHQYRFDYGWEDHRAAD